MLIPNSVHDVLSEFLCFFDAAGYLYESTSELERQLREGGNFEFRLKGESWFVEPASHRATLEAGTVLTTAELLLKILEAVPPLSRSVLADRLFDKNRKPRTADLPRFENPKPENSLIPEPPPTAGMPAFPTP